MDTSVLSVEDDKENEIIDEEEANEKLHKIIMEKHGINISYVNPKNIPTYMEQYIVNKDDRITSDLITTCELGAVRAFRAMQIESGAVPYVDIGFEYEAQQIVTKELMTKKCPLSIKRVYGDEAEIWMVNELIIPFELLKK